jgi:hypothetical protein
LVTSNVEDLAGSEQEHITLHLGPSGCVGLEVRFEPTSVQATSTNVRIA